MKKILILPSWYPTEDNCISGIFFREQALALNRTKYSVSVLAPPHFHNPYLLHQRFRRRKMGLDIKQDKGMSTYRWYGWNWIPYPHILKLVFILRAGEKIFQEYVANSGKPDIIHVHSAFPSGILANQLKKKYDIPYLITEHSSQIAKGSIRPWLKLLVSNVYHHADHRIVVSPKLGEMLETQYNKKFHTWSYIPNIVDQRFISFSGLNKCDSNPTFRFLNIGFLIEIKGQIDLIHAFAKGFQGNQNVELRIGGVGPMQRDLEQLVEDLDIQAQVVFLGQLSREQVLNEMQLADVFVLSSHFETFGVVLIEALACGKCVVATACGGPECIVNKQNGLLVSTHNPDELAVAMQQIRRSYSSYNPTEIRNDCLARFGESVVIDQLVETYNDVLGR